jgi:hypothetical protein
VPRYMRLSKWTDGLGEFAKLGPSLHVEIVQRGATLEMRSGKFRAVIDLDWTRTSRDAEDEFMLVPNIKLTEGNLSGSLVEVVRDRSQLETLIESMTKAHRLLGGIVVQISGDL